MSILEEHNYGAITVIKSEADRSPLQTTELNIKMECEEPQTDTAESEMEPPVTQRLGVKRIKCENPEESSDDEELFPNLSGSDLRKACVLQTCFRLLDSSSSDEDDLMLLWLLYRNEKKKKLVKRRQL